MIFFKKYFRGGRVIAMLFILVASNVVVWGGVVKVRPTGSLYSSGVLFSSDGAAINFSDRLDFKKNTFTYSVKYTWNGKVNSMQEVGTFDNDLLGGINIEVSKSSSFGSNLLNELDLDDDAIFNRSYMQSGRAKLFALRLPDEFGNYCYYLMFSEKIFCGAKKLYRLSVKENMSVD